MINVSFFWVVSFVKDLLKTVPPALNITNNSLWNFGPLLSDYEGALF